MIEKSRVGAADSGKFAFFVLVLWGRIGFDSDSGCWVQACRAMW